MMYLSIEYIIALCIWAYVTASLSLMDDINNSDCSWPKNTTIELQRKVSSSPLSYDFLTLTLTVEYDSLMYKGDYSTGCRVASIKIGCGSIMMCVMHS